MSVDSPQSANTKTSPAPVISLQAQGHPVIHSIEHFLSSSRNIDQDTRSYGTSSKFEAVSSSSTASNSSRHHRSDDSPPGSCFVTSSLRSSTEASKPSVRGNAMDLSINDKNKVSSSRRWRWKVRSGQQSTSLLCAYFSPYSEIK